MFKGNLVSTLSIYFTKTQHLWRLYGGLNDKPPYYKPLFYNNLSANMEV